MSVAIALVQAVLRLLLACVAIVAALVFGFAVVALAFLLLEALHVP